MIASRLSVSVRLPEEDVRPGGSQVGSQPLLAGDMWPRSAGLAFSGPVACRSVPRPIR